MENGTPYSTMLSKLYYSETKEGEKTQVAYVQEIPDFDPAPEGIEWSALKALDKTKDYYWFILLPEETATQTGKPVCFYFQAKVRLGMNALAVDEMLQETLTLYKSTAVEESKGLPTALQRGEKRKEDRK